MSVAHIYLLVVFGGMHMRHLNHPQELIEDVNRVFDEKIAITKKRMLGGAGKK